MEQKYLINIVIVVIFIAGGVLTYFYFYGSADVAPADESAPVESASEEAQSEEFGGATYVELTKRFSRIKLDSSIVETQAFRNLQDFLTPVREEPVGVSNPFDVAP